MATFEVTEDTTLVDVLEEFGFHFQGGEYRKTWVGDAHEDLEFVATIIRTGPSPIWTIKIWNPMTNGWHNECWCAGSSVLDLYGSLLDVQWIPLMEAEA